MTQSVSRRHFVGWSASLAATLSALACKAIRKPTSGQKSDPSGGETDFDYIVIGSGAGGGPLAVNLAKAGFKTLLLEAGSDRGNTETYRIPSFHTLASEDPDMSWDFYVKHFDSDAKDKEDSKYVKDKGILYPRAGTLGGCTAHNAMITVYQTAAEWDQMAHDVNDGTFDSKTMRRYFELVENLADQPDKTRTKGWLQVRYASPFLVLFDKVIIANLFAAARSFSKRQFNNVHAGVNLKNLVFNSDTNSKDPSRDSAEGLALVPLATTKEGRRRCVRDYIFENRENPNLTVRTECLVTKLIFSTPVEGQELSVEGVEYVKGPQSYKAFKNPASLPPEKLRANAKREVIVSGGTFNTPQLLMLSGIGPKQELEKFSQENSNYKVLLDLPGVGKNMQDRYEVGVVHRAEKKLDITADCAFKVNMSDKCYVDWKEKGAGPYTSNGGVVAILKKSHPSLTSPDLFMFLLPTDFRGYRPGYSFDTINSKNFTTWAILKAKTHNKAGYVQLKSLDPTDTPIVNFRYYEDGTAPEGQPLSDLDAMVAGVKYIRQLAKDANSVYDHISIRASDVPELLGAPSVQHLQEVCPGDATDSDSKIREWVRRNSWGHHACGTCKMGDPQKDKMAVVDSRFKVIGTKNLRVVDASIFPRIPGYFIVSSIYTISEKATDDILEDAGRQRRVSLYNPNGDR